jgi:hypothetical protein
MDTHLVGLRRCKKILSANSAKPPRSLRFGLFIAEVAEKGCAEIAENES